MRALVGAGRKSNSDLPFVNSSDYSRGLWGHKRCRWFRGEHKESNHDDQIVIIVLPSNYGNFIKHGNSENV